MKRLILRPAVLLAVMLTVFAINIQAQDLNSAISLTRSEQYDKAEEMLKQLITERAGKQQKLFLSWRELSC